MSVSAADDGRRRWNEVHVGDTTINVERPPAHLAKIDLDSIKYTPAGEKWPHKDQCASCRMYFHRDSMITRVPNHRVVDMRKNLGVPMEGQRYSTASYLYANSLVCVLCTQLFDYPEEEEPYSPNKSRVTKDTDDDTSLASKTSHESTTNMSSIEAKFQRNSILTPVKDFKKISKKGKSFVETIGKYKLEIKTALQRTNIAMLDAGCRTYQSSIVDNMDSSNAVTVPYHAWSKTRREVDPWWEVDFGGRPKNLHSISFLSNMTSKENISIMVLLLKRPVGFENPFLDKIVGEAVQYREFELIPMREGAESSRYFWEMDSCTCKAVRVQLRGIKPLAIKEFKAFLGDDFVQFDEDKAIRVIHQSFATFSPSRQERALHSMLVESKKALPVLGLKEDNGPKVFRCPNREELFQKTARLDKKVAQRYRSQQAWSAKTLQIIKSVFTEAEAKAVFYQIFACALLDEKGLSHDAGFLTTANMGQVGFPLLGGGVREGEVEKEKEERMERQRAKKRKEEEEMAMLRAMSASDGTVPGGGVDGGPSGTFMTASTSFSVGTVDGNQKISSKSYDVEDDMSVNSLNSHGSPRKETLVDRDGAMILADCINMPEPRCSLPSLHEKLRHVTLTIQSAGIHLKTPELIFLSQNTSYAKIYSDSILSSEGLMELRSIFDRLEAYWDKQDEKAMKTDAKLEAKRSANMLRTGKMPQSKADERERQVPRKAVTKSLRGVSWSQAAMCIALWLKRKSQQIPSKVFGVTLEDVHGSLHHASSSGIGSPRSAAGSTSDLVGLGNSGSIMRSRSSEALPPGKGNDVPPGFLDSRFSEYKLSNFKRRFYSEPEFPTELSASFSADELFREAKEKEKARLSAEWAAKIEEKRGKDVSKKEEIKIVWPDEGSEREPEETPAPVSMLPTSMGGAGGPLSAIAAAAAAKDDSTDKESREFLGLPYVCGLCTKRFPYNSTNCKVMYKHIITIRKAWDRSLVPKEIESLEQGTSMFNLTNICSFCAQFFDPDVEGGISYPKKDVNVAKKAQYTSDMKAESLVSKFFDSRFGLDSNLNPAEFLNRPSTSKFRETAMFAIQISDRIQEDREIEAARIAAAKKLGENIVRPMDNEN